jgi:hypothetical protein
MGGPGDEESCGALGMGGDCKMKKGNEMRELSIENAKITSTSLGQEDHGIFTCYVLCEFGSGGCGFGGYALDEWVESKEAQSRIGIRHGVH